MVSSRALRGSAIKWHPAGLQSEDITDEYPAADLEYEGRHLGNDDEDGDNDSDDLTGTILFSLEEPSRRLTVLAAFAFVFSEGLFQRNSEEHYPFKNKNAMGMICQEPLKIHRSIEESCGVITRASRGRVCSGMNRQILHRLLSGDDQCVTPLRGVLSSSLTLLCLL